MAALPCSMKAQFTAGVDALTARVADAKRPQPPNENGATARCPRFEKPEIQSALETRNVVQLNPCTPPVSCVIWSASAAGNTSRVRLPRPAHRYSDARAGWSFLLYRPVRTIGVSVPIKRASS
jgi:hypothetical protein